MSPRPERLRTVQTPDGSVVLDIESGKMFRLNPIGAQILCLLNQGTPIPRVVEEISREYHVDIETVREDLLYFFAALEDCGLVQQKVADSPSCSGR